jgi:phosphate ABC transporter, permease protein PstC
MTPPSETPDGSTGHETAAVTGGDFVADRVAELGVLDGGQAATVQGSAVLTSNPAVQTAVDEPTSVQAASAVRLEGSGRARVGDRLFSWLTGGAGGLVVVLIALVAAFLVSSAAPVIAEDHANFLFSRGFQVGVSPLRFGVIDLLWVTVVSSAIALLLAVPVAVGIALFITQYAAATLRKPIGYLIDLLAAIPSIVYGIWGIYELAPHLVIVQRALYHLGWIPLFQDEGVETGSIFDAGVVLAIMILPIVTAVARDVFDSTPRANIEAAWALGATRWEMIRCAVLPFGRSGVISGAMLGLGRALGETIAVMLILSKPSISAPFSFSIFDGGQTFASLIGLNMQEANGQTETGAYIAAGLVLFVLTFVVNAAARAVVARRGEFR